MEQIMKQRRLPGIFFLWAILGILLAMGASVSRAQTNVLLVSNTNDAGAGSLRAAINVARADGAPTAILFDTSVLPCPVTIFVGSTTGSQFATLNDPGDTIDAKACGVTLDGSALAGSEDGLRIRKSNVTIRGLTIRNFPRDGMRIQPNSGGNQTVTGVVITKNTFKGNLDGLRVSGGDGPGNVVGATIANNEFIENRDDGINVRGSFGDPGDGGNEVKVVINNNLIRDSQGQDTGGATTGDGIRVLGGPGSSGQGVNGGNRVTAIISNNDVRDNVDDGILVAGAGGTDASNHTVFTKIIANKVENNGRANATAGNGIVVRGGSTSFADPPGSGNTVTFLVANNAPSKSKDDGIRISGGAGISHTVSGTVSNNEVERNGGRGIDASGGDGNVLNHINILDNNINRSGLSGIRVAGGSGSGTVLSDITIKGNRSERSGNDGITVVSGSATVSVTGITDNETKLNDRDGIFVGSGVAGSGATPVSQNKTNSNRQDGIDLNDGGYVVLDNTFNSNMGAGLDADDAGTGVNFDGGENSGVGNATCNTPGCF